MKHLLALLFVASCIPPSAFETAPAPAAAAEPAAQSSPDLLQWLVGDWIGTNHQFTFWEDGSVRRSVGVGYQDPHGSYGCVYTINEIGTATQQGDLLILDFPATQNNNCGEHEETPGLIVRYRIEWVENPYADDPSVPELQLRDLDCTNGDMWCVDRMRRR